ncbi:hypothetical protein FNF29_00584 [Cafeteria roenbergensis]|nr:hypothetical protein FNF29_00584 [Cafeteria roenbergensis]KAA0168310.1 hypothetical protein FNF28_02470 [Cafeteria roenbergensis]|eukprot:KAA0157232.1 hypothetical protein FNF29_00584 [Cafeteria roenbergensis]
MAIYSRLRFEDARSAPREQAAALLSEGWREVEEMDFYHRAREAKNQHSAPLAECLRAGTGMGGTVGKPRAEPLHAAAPPVAGPSVKATTKRYNPPNTFFRKLFERGDLPIRVKHTGSGIRVDWTKPADKVDLHHFLPVFVSGLREVEEPYMSLAQFGTQDLLAVGGDRLLPVVPQLVQPLREALATRDPGIVRRVMLVMQRLVTCGDLVGEALVPFYRQLLPVLSIFKSKHDDLGDAIDYGQRFRRSMGDLVQETLETLELHGGPDAFINLRYCVPSYESVVYTV